MRRQQLPKTRNWPAEIRIWRDGRGPHINLPVNFHHHTYAGFDWGRNGPGASELALILVQSALEHAGYFGRSINLARGQCFKRAWRMHQAFKRSVVVDKLAAGQNHAIQWDDIDAWIAQWQRLDAGAANDGRAAGPPQD